MNLPGNEWEMTLANNYVTDSQIKNRRWKPVIEVPAMLFAKVGAAVLLNRKRLCTTPFLMDNNTMAYSFGNEWDPYFGKTAFENIDLPSLVQIGALPSYNASDVEGINIYLPQSLEEQKQIGSFFEKVNDLITLHQRKLDLLKDKKKALLQKMFPKEGETVPELRFPGFTQPWEQRKLGELTKRVIRKNKNLESDRPLTISAQDGLVDQESFFNKRVASKDLQNYLVVINGEFAYNKSYSSGYPWGAVKRLEKYPCGVVSSLYIVFAPVSEKVDSQFLVTLFEDDGWHSEISKRAAEGARNHGLLNIPASDFFDIDLKLPSIDEQKRIGAFFEGLDNLITLHQRQLNLLKEQKKGLLQKMFPKEGENEPEIRFPEFR